jgi:hypothetical protein
VEASESQCFVPGCSLKFVLHFDRAPQHYGGGNVGAHFERVTDTSSSELYNGMELDAGVSLENVSVLLGHGSIRVTQQHYAPWVKSRQDALDREVLKVISN